MPISGFVVTVKDFFKTLLFIYGWSNRMLIQKSKRKSTWKLKMFHLIKNFINQRFIIAFLTNNYIFYGERFWLKIDDSTVFFEFESQDELFRFYEYITLFRFYEYITLKHLYIHTHTYISEFNTQWPLRGQFAIKPNQHQPKHLHLQIIYIIYV